MHETEKKTKVSALLTQLTSKEESTQLAAIQSLKADGNASAIEPLVSLLSTSDSEAVKSAIVDLLNTVKSSAVPSALINCLQQGHYQNIHNLLMASIWNSGLDYRSHLGAIAEATVRGGFIEAVEFMTIVENTEQPFTEDQLMDALLVLGTHLASGQQDHSPKNELIREIAGTLQQMSDSL